MFCVRISFCGETKRELSEMNQKAQTKGDLSALKRIWAVTAIAAGEAVSSVCRILNVSDESVRQWVKKLMLQGPKALISQKIPGRKSRLTQSQKKELDQIICDGPVKAGFPGACWRSPMIQALIYNKYGVFYSIHYISQILKNMGFSYQKARFSPDKGDPKQRREWLEVIWQ